jgi:hypothetical protein
MAGISAGGVVVLDHLLNRRSALLAIFMIIVNVVVLGLFVGVVALVVADVQYREHHRGMHRLLGDAWASLGPLVMTGVVAALAVTLISSVGSVIAFSFLAVLLLNAGSGPAGLFVGILFIPVLVVIPELLLFTRWSVAAAVAVLERPRGLRALRRSRELVRGNGWRVLALILVLELPLTLVLTAVEKIAGTAAGGTALGAQMLVVSFIAPIPVLAITVLYFELLGDEADGRPGEAPTPGSPTPLASEL